MNSPLELLFGVQKFPECLLVSVYARTPEIIKQYILTLFVILKQHLKIVNKSLYIYDALESPLEKLRC